MLTLRKKISSEETNSALDKIRSKYKELSFKYGKSSKLILLFNERYMSALKSDYDIATFLIAEIETVNELIGREEAKLLTANNNVKRKSFADVVYEENQKAIDKYDKVYLHEDADDEIAKLLGATRIIINYYLPIVARILKLEKDKGFFLEINSLYDRMIRDYGFKGEVPAARSYVHSLSVITTKTDMYHNALFKETSFLINEFYIFVKKIIVNDRLSYGDMKIILKPDDILFQLFNSKTMSEAFNFVLENTENIIKDFRIMHIRRAAG